jgi:hypothetical protein
MHTPCARFPVPGPLPRSSALGIRPSESDRIRYRVPGIGYRAPGTRDPIDAEDRTPSTEDRARGSENAHTRYA